MAIKGIYSEFRFLYETVWQRTGMLGMAILAGSTAESEDAGSGAKKGTGEGFLKRQLGPHQRYDSKQKKYVSIQHQNGEMKELVLNTRLANEELAGSLLSCRLVSPASV